MLCRVPSWEELYQKDTIERLPWYWPALDPDLEAALAGHEIALGRILDHGRAELHASTKPPSEDDGETSSTRVLPVLKCDWHSPYQTLWRLSKPHGNRQKTPPVRVLGTLPLEFGVDARARRKATSNDPPRRDLCEWDVNGRARFATKPMALEDARAAVSGAKVLVGPW
jgi:hypothetical protein